ncbi:PREDICTED: VWFA and cache domain-containing protein CG16868-like [Branchiostoma belcheri]|uniref:VWFA and cache domain-containing protein CG16868-like n=1 Tax=Branchiostoma belcheri TaxID=7741 RepID=A0A6P5AV53_BRABE|nr:PREDICTED: VWFA and cache domain-containing protein CG16868-like [Branchiostoma belcheri]
MCPDSGGLRGPVMPTKAVLLVFLAALWSPSLGDLSTAPITTDWIPRVSRKMTTFAESQTGALQLVQEYDDKLSFSQTQIDGQAQLNLLTQAAGDRLKKCREILHRNKAEIEASHAQGPAGGASASDCCDNLGQLEYDPRFLQQIVNDTCATFTAVAGATNTIRPHVYNIMKSNSHEMSGVTWQYYGAKEGEYHQFPKNDRFCNESAHIFRNWYVSAASPKKKNVVIVIDISGSMNTAHRIDLAKQAALTVLDTLTARDWVGVVSFSNEAETPHGCLGDSLGEANPGNIEIMRDFINNLRPFLATYYSKAFEKAFDIFHDAKQKKPEQFYDSDNVIIFLTDGQPSDPKNVLDQITEGQSRMNEDCRQSTYGPCFASGRDPQGVGPYGRTDNVGDGQGEKLTAMMGSYYDFFQSEPEPKFSVPTKDEHLGLTITGAIRTADSNGVFFGVTAVDISMDIVFNEIVNFNLGLYSHAFLVDREDGRVLLHRDLPKPMEWPTDPTFLHLNAMKGELPDDEVTKILNGESGSCYVNDVKVPVTRGDAQFDGVFTLVKPANFYYESIPDSKYSVVLCLFEEDRTITVPNQVNPENVTESVFHQLDPAMNTDVCRMYNNYATQDGSTVMFPPYAYTDPVGYLSSVETAVDVANIEQFLNDVTGSVDNPGLVEGVRTDVVLTAAIEQYWRQNASDSVWRYFMDLPTAPSTEHDHLTNKFPWLANELVSRGGLLMSGLCNSYVTQDSQLFYDTSGFTGLHVTTGSDPCTQFSMYPITNTNTFLLVLHNRQTNNCQDSQTQDCSCDKDCQSCDASVQSSCQDYTGTNNSCHDYIRNNNGNNNRCHNDNKDNTGDNGRCHNDNRNNNGNNNRCHDYNRNNTGDNDRGDHNNNRHSTDWTPRRLHGRSCRHVPRPV